MVVTDVVAEAADLRVTKTGPPTVIAGFDISYKVTVTNNGPNAAKTVKLSDPLPANTTFLSITPNSGCTTTGGAVNCTIGTLAPGASATFTLVYNVDGLKPPPGTTLTNKASVTSITTDPTSANNFASASTVTDILRWKPIPQDIGGTLLPDHFQAIVPGGALILSVLDRREGDGVALTFVPQQVDRLVWQRVAQNFGGPDFPEHFQATVPGGALIVSVLNRQKGTGVGLGFVPQRVNRLDWQQVTQNFGGPEFPRTFAAPAGSGALIVSVLNRERGTGVGLGFVPQRVNRLDWKNLQQPSPGPDLPLLSAAPAAGGSLVIAVLNRKEGDGVALDFVPQSVSQIVWRQIQQDLGGPLKPISLRAAVPGGVLITSVLTREKGAGTGLTFVPK